MATSSVICSRFHGLAVLRAIPCSVRVLCHASRVFNVPSSTPSYYRSVHTTPGLSAKSYLHKFSSKNKKKHWNDSPWPFPVENKPPGLMALIKQQKAEKAKNNVRIRAFNVILYEAITGLLRTSEVSDEVYDLFVELSKVSVSGDFLVCRAYWLSSGNKDTDDKIEEVLQKYAPRFRHLLISYRTLGNVPHIVFVRDKDDFKRQQVEDLLASLQFEKDTIQPAETDEPRSVATESPTATSIQLPNIFGIDHEGFNQQILAYKTKMKTIEVETDRNEYCQRQKEQLAAIRKQNIQKKQMKKQKQTDDISPQEYLLSMESEQEGMDFELYENMVEFNDEKEKP